MSRLLAGSFGCLGIITEVSLKVLPKARQQASLVLELDSAEALRELSAWRKAALPLSGACHLDGRLHIRLEGATGSVRSALDRIGGTELAAPFWDSLRDHRLPFFDDARPLWRLSYRTMRRSKRFRALCWSTGRARNAGSRATHRHRPSGKSRQRQEVTRPASRRLPTSNLSIRFQMDS